MTIWTTLQAHSQRLTAISTGELNKDQQRSSNLTFDLAGCHFDLSRQRFDQSTLNDLVALAKEANVASLRDALFAGQPINVSENRAVLHMALRGGAPNLATELVRELDAARQNSTSARKQYAQVIGAVTLISRSRMSCTLVLAARI